MLSVFGCSSPTDGSDTTEHSGEDPGSCVLPYISYDYDEFISDWKAAQSESADSKNPLTIQKSSKDDVVSIVVPELKYDKYEFKYMSVNDYSYYYVYKPFSVTEYDHDYELSVSVIKILLDFSDDAVTIDGALYDPHDNRWRIYYYNSYIEVKFPKHLVLDSPDDIADYFTFTRIMASDDSSVRQ